MCEYLQLRGSTYYFRRPIPKGLERHLRDGESRAFQHSLRTKDKKEAKRLRTQCIAITDEIIASAERRQNAASITGASPLSPAAGRRQQERERAAWEYEEWAAAEQAADAAQDAFHADHLTDLEEKHAYLAKKDWAGLTDQEKVIKSLMESRTFEKEIAQHRQEASQARYNAAGREVAVSWTQRLEVPPAALSESPADSEGLSLLEACTRWADERDVSDRTRRATEGMANRFIEICGVKSVGRYTRADAIAFKDALLSAGGSGRNTNTTLRKLGTVFRWAAQNAHCETNPLHGVRVIGGRASSVPQRRAFTLSELRAVFRQPMFLGERIPTRGRGAAAFWLPLLALYTGARREELGQLRVCDISLDEYADGSGGTAKAWFISITDEGEGDLSVKTEQSKRRVPIHTQLIALGLIDHWREMESAGEFQLFPRLTAHSNGRRTGRWGDWFSSFLRTDCRILDRAVVFHSFRHTFKAQARECGLTEAVQRQLMGHEGGDVADRYGGPVSDRLLVEGIASYQIAGLDMSGLKRPS